MFPEQKCSANAGSHSASQDSSLAQNILGFASQVQQAVLVGRPAAAMPSFSLLAWADARVLALHIGRLVEPETWGLLLHIVLALPPPHTVCRLLPLLLLNTHSLACPFS